MTIRSFANDLLRKTGFEVVRAGSRPGPNYDHEAQARAAIAKVRDHTMVSDAPLVSLYQQVRHCELNGIPGDYVECGVWKGGAVGLMALANLEHGAARRRLHLFDAFDDICEPDPEHDGDFALDTASRMSGRDRSEFAGRLQPLKGIYDARGGHGTVAGARDLLVQRIGYDAGSISFHKGWFQDTLPLDAPAIDRIAILRLDGDFYASTQVCLEHLYDKLVPGGFLILDDYGTWAGCRKATDEFRARRGIRSFIHHVNRDCRYWVKE